MKIIILFVVAFFSLYNSYAQTVPIIHSHNDYRQKVPFWTAYNAGIGSIEADLYLRGEDIVVCHDKEEVATAPLFEELYIKPMLTLDSKDLNFNFMIDFKMSASTLMKPFEKLLAKYPQIFGGSNVKVVMTGSRPPKEEWPSYPAYIMFDGLNGVNYSKAELAKVNMISAGIHEYTNWNGKGTIPPEQEQLIKNDAAKAKELNKPFRLWGIKNNPNSWIILYKLGVNVINTDFIEQCSHYFKVYNRNQYQLKEPQPIYTPTYASDGKKAKPKNVIFIVGDGMSIVQITAAETANRGKLSLLNMKNIGFIKTWSANSYTTDSAGAGSALGTGRKTNNRYIGALPNGEYVENITEKLSSMDYKIGVFTNGSVTDATPAGQYGHSIERDSSDLIAACLLNESVDILIGANRRTFENRSDKRNLFDELSAKGYEIADNEEEFEEAEGRIIYIDEKYRGNAKEDDIDEMAEDAAELFDKLSNKKGFYTLIEESRIDHAGHANNMKVSVLETLRLDAIVSEALKFADENGETLVVVTGDHETGALTLMDGNRDNGTINGFYASDDHTGVLIPVFAYGVGAAEFRGVYENTDIFHKIVNLLER